MGSELLSQSRIENLISVGGPNMRRMGGLFKIFFENTNSRGDAY